ncbi:MAG: hypothetical protein WCC95_04175, partial [Candidatus Sulfotelmatobacter sp.]
HHPRCRKAIGPWYERYTLAHLGTLAIQSVCLGNQPLTIDDMARLASNWPASRPGRSARK